LSVLNSPIGLLTESLLIKLTEINPFDWDTSAEARDLWLGYPISPRVTPDLWPELRPFLLKVFPHSGELGEYEEIFDSFFAFVLLNSDLHLGPADARSALKVASAKGRHKRQTTGRNKSTPRLITVRSSTGRG